MQTNTHVKAGRHLRTLTNTHFLALSPREHGNYNVLAAVSRLWVSPLKGPELLADRGDFRARTGKGQGAGPGSRHAETALPGGALPGQVWYS